MYAMTIRFTVPANTDWEAVRQLQVRRAFEMFRHVSGLRAKAFVFSPERGEVGGNYVWETQDDAEAYLRSDLFRASNARYGQPRLLEGAEISAYVEDGDIVFPPDYEVHDAMGPDAAVPPLGL
jgi:hypothetical protein